MISIFKALAQLADSFWVYTKDMTHEAKVNAFTEVLRLLCIAFDFTLVNWYDNYGDRAYVISIPKTIRSNDENNMGT